MAMGKRKRNRQRDLWISFGEMAKAPGHPFYERVNKVLEKAGFDDFVEQRCAQFYAAGMGRPSLAPGIYIRLLVVGYFEGLDSERGMAWRAADSLALREFLGLKLSESPPDHSTISRTRRLIDVETHEAVFSWALKQLAESGLVKGKTIGIDATTLEANAAMRSIVRQNTGEGYEEFVKRLAQASGMETPSREDLAKLDRKRPKKGSNQDWTHPHDPDSKITKMKDGRTHLAHKVEHAVDLETGAMVAVTVQGADRGDTTSMIETLIEAAEKVEEALPCSDGMQEVVADKGYHSTARMVDLAAVGVRSYVSEPKRGRRRWKGKLEAQGCRVCESSANSRWKGASTVATTGRIAGTPLCPSLRDGWDETESPSRWGKPLEAIADSRQCLQPGSTDAPAARRRDAQGSPGPPSGTGFHAPVAAEGQKRHHRLDLRSFRR